LPWASASPELDDELDWQTST